ncbi:hypothetical protein MASR2M48_33770 [Spirochaetota bacterium]
MARYTSRILIKLSVSEPFALDFLLIGDDTVGITVLVGSSLAASWVMTRLVVATLVSRNDTT